MVRWLDKPDGWIISSVGTEESIVRLFRLGSLQAVMAFSDRAMQLLTQENALGSSMMSINAFECVISLIARDRAVISDDDRRLASLLDRAYEAMPR